MAEVIWLDAALADLDGLKSYIAVDNPVAADGIGTRLFNLGQSLCDFPNRGRTTGTGEREMTSVPPYVLTYRVEGETVSIIAIRHGRRQPR